MWLERAAGDGSGKNVIEPIGGCDHFREWIQKNLAGEVVRAPFAFGALKNLFVSESRACSGNCRCFQGQRVHVHAHGARQTRVATVYRRRQPYSVTCKCIQSRAGMLERGCGLLLLLLVFYVFGAGAGKGGGSSTV